MKGKEKVLWASVMFILSVGMVSAILINNPNLPLSGSNDNTQLNAGSGGITGTFRLECDTTLSVDFLQQSFILTKKFQNLTYSNGLLVSNTTCA